MPFFKIDFYGQIHMIKVSQRNFEELDKAIKIKCGVSEVKYFANTVELTKEDVAEYVTQYITDSNFVLYVKGLHTQAPNEKFELNLLSPESSVSDDIQIITYNDLGLRGSDNFNTKEELQASLEKHHRIIFENFKIHKTLSNAERIKINKTIIRHLLIVPTTIISTTELEIISVLISEVLVGELSTTY